jgi:hypothetical protein
MGAMPASVRIAAKINDRMDHLNDAMQTLGLSWASIPLAQEDASEYVRNGRTGEGALLGKLARHAALNKFLAGKIHGDVHTLGACRSYVQYGGELVELIEMIRIHEFFRVHVGCSKIEDRERALYGWMCENSVITILELTPSIIQSSRNFDVLLVRRALAFGSSPPTRFSVVKAKKVCQGTVDRLQIV